MELPARSWSTFSTGRFLAAFSVYICIYIARACFMPIVVLGEGYERGGNEIDHVIRLHHLYNGTSSFLRPHFH